MLWQIFKWFQTELLAGNSTALDEWYAEQKKKNYFLAKNPWFIEKLMKIPGNSLEWKLFKICLVSTTTIFSKNDLRTGFV